MKAGIIGLGLMGGSLGLALKETSLFNIIVGDDINPVHRRQAVYLGLVDECLDLNGILDCDVIFICTPVDSIVELIKDIKSLREDQLVIDFGGVKKEIIQAIPKELRLNFVSLHPMCGTENFGPKAAFKELYKNQIMIFVDMKDSGEYQVNLAREICMQLGMNIVKMDSKNHDRHTAFISHMPHILSYALANTVLKQENPQDIVAIAGGGFKGMSRISKSSGIMWSAISKQNKENLLESIDTILDELHYAKYLIGNNKFDELQEWMTSANKLRDII